MIERSRAEQTYRPNGYGMSAGLLRARREFRLRNVTTGLLLAGFVSGIWAYSIRSVKQENFDDIDEEARILAAKRDRPQ